jgi:polyhydroxyalkanoate depolymerase
MDAYLLYEISHAVIQPWRATAEATKLLFSNPLNPLAYTPYGRTVAAACELFERTTRRYGKPVFGLTIPNGEPVPVAERVVWSRPFCRVVAFDRGQTDGGRREPKLLIVAPLSGHFATLLRGTVEAFVPTHQVFITDWVDARMVPLAEGRFDLDDYIDYLISMFRALGPNLHVMAVCQPSVPVIAAIARMEAENPAYAAQHDLDGWTNRHPSFADRREPPRREARHRLVQTQVHRQSAAGLSGLRTRRLPGLPPAFGLYGYEHGPARHSALGHVQASRPR